MGSLWQSFRPHVRDFTLLLAVAILCVCWMLA